MFTYFWLCWVFVAVHGLSLVAKVKSLSCVWLFATPWTVAHKAPLSMEFSRQEYWSGLPFPSPGDLLSPGIEPRAFALQADALPSEPPGKHLCREQGYSLVVVPGLSSTGSVAVAHGFSCSAACGISPGQGSNSHFLHWQADSWPLSPQGSPCMCFLWQLARCVVGIIVTEHSPVQPLARGRCCAPVPLDPVTRQWAPPTSYQLSVSKG